MTTTEGWKALGLHETLMKTLEAFDFQYMMPVQKAAIPMFMKNYDVAVEA